KRQSGQREARRATATVSCNVNKRVSAGLRALADERTASPLKRYFVRRPRLQLSSALSRGRQRHVVASKVIEEAKTVLHNEGQNLSQRGLKLLRRQFEIDNVFSPPLPN